jgi:hypothetical protein
VDTVASLRALFNKYGQETESHFDEAWAVKLTKIVSDKVV